MGSSYLSVVLYARKGQLEQEIKNALERAKNLKSIDEVGEAYLELDAGDVLDDVDPERPGCNLIVLETIRKDLAGAAELVLRDYNESTQSMVGEIGAEREYEVMIAAGISWGDDPNEVYGAIAKLDRSRVFKYPESKRTEFLTSRDYDEALWSQEACNLSGIVFSFAETMQKICNESHRDGHGTEWRNNHPICRLYAEQIAHLARKREYSDAYEECKKKAEKAK